MSDPPAILFGVPVDNYTMIETIERFDHLVRLGRSQNRATQVATVNVDFLVNALNDPEIMALLQRAELNLADGLPLVWASRLFGTRLVERVAGADLVPVVAAAAVERDWSVHLFGAAPGVADRARELLVDRHPGARITSDSGPAVDDPHVLDEAIVASIRTIDPDILCVALGNPKQERFIDTYRAALRCPVMIGIGGSLDMLTGDKKRAPRVLQRVGAEWLYRAAQEPRRLGRRYAHDLHVIGPAAVAYWARLRRYRRGTARLGMRVDDTRMLVRNGLAATRVPSWQARGISSVQIDLSGVHELDPTSHSLIINVLREASLYHADVHVTDIGPVLRECFEDYGTWSLVAALVE